MFYEGTPPPLGIDQNEQLYRIMANQAIDAKLTPQTIPGLTPSGIEKVRALIHEQKLSVDALETAIRFVQLLIRAIQSAGKEVNPSELINDPRINDLPEGRAMIVRAILQNIETVPQDVKVANKPEPVIEDPDTKSALRFLASFQAAFKRDLTLTEIDGLKSDAWNSLPSVVQAKVRELVAQRTAKNTKVVVREYTVAEIDSLANHFLSGFRTAFQREMTSYDLEIINNEAWRKLPEVVKQKIRDIVSEKKS